MRRRALSILQQIDRKVRWMSYLRVVNFFGLITMPHPAVPDRVRLWRLRGRVK